jgi:hypothetical protein
MLQYEAAPIFDVDHLYSVPITAQNSRNVMRSMQEERLLLSEREWTEQPIPHTTRTNNNTIYQKRVVENVLSVSISHTTLERNPQGRLRHFKSLIKCISDIVSSIWKLILHTRKKAQVGACSRSDLKLTKESIESFESWFNDKYMFFTQRLVKHLPEDFYSDTVRRVK